MDQTRARALLAAERVQLKRLLQAETGEPQAADVGDEVDDADRRNAEQTGTAVDQHFRGSAARSHGGVLGRTAVGEHILRGTTWPLGGVKRPGRADLRSAPPAAAI
jgi:hypothetical protein